MKMKMNMNFAPCIPPVQCSCCRHCCLWFCLLCELPIVFTWPSYLLCGILLPLKTVFTYNGCSRLCMHNFDVKICLTISSADAFSASWILYSYSPGCRNILYVLYCTIEYCVYIACSRLCLQCLLQIAFTVHGADNVYSACCSLCYVHMRNGGICPHGWVCVHLTIFTVPSPAWSLPAKCKKEMLFKHSFYPIHPTIQTFQDDSLHPSLMGIILYSTFCSVEEGGHFLILWTACVCCFVHITHRIMAPSWKY